MTPSDAAVERVAKVDVQLARYHYFLHLLFFLCSLLVLSVRLPPIGITSIGDGSRYFDDYSVYYGQGIVGVAGFGGIVSVQFV